MTQDTKEFLQLGGTLEEALIKRERVEGLPYFEKKLDRIIREIRQARE